MNDALSEVASNSPAGQYLSGTVNDIRIGPYGQRLLVEADMDVRVVGAVEQPLSGTVYLVGEPRLDVDNRRIVLTEVDVDTDSKDKLIAALGENLVEPWLRELLAGLEGVPLDLHPIYDQTRTEAIKVLEGVSNYAGIEEYADIDIELTDVNLSGLGIGAEYLRLIATVTGRAQVDLQ